MVFTQGPSAHLPTLSTRAGLGTIFRSSGIARFVHGGVVKTFRCLPQMPEFDWSKYEAMRDSDASPHDVYRAAVADGFRPFPECIKMLIDVFGVTLARAKEIYLQADGIAESLDRYQESLVPALEEALKTLDDAENQMDT